MELPESTSTSSAKPLNGADYIATVRFSDVNDHTLANPGDTCERIPLSCLPDWIAQGVIVPKPEKDA